MKKKKVLFVCLGNICRSPSAEAVLKKLIEVEKLKDKIEVDSSGTIDYHQGEPADKRMQMYAAKRGYTLDHISRKFDTKKDFVESDYIIVMDNEIYRDVTALDIKNKFRDKIFKMSQFSGKIKFDEVTDPYYLGAEGFEAVLDILEDSCKILLEKIKDDIALKVEIEKEARIKIKSVSPLSGGCISTAYRITDETGKNYFLKLNSSPKDLFIKEAHGLTELKKANAIRVPEVITAAEDYLLTEFILQGNRSKTFFEDFGRMFAELHKYRGEKFGFYENNYIGSNRQVNIPNDNEDNDWTEFYLQKRILYQYKLVEKNGYSSDELKSGILLLEKIIEKIIPDSGEAPSLLHGDLWGGNYIVDENGNACLIDPAVYYGNREADLAMTKLFGGFDEKFYLSYNESFPLNEDYKYRENIYKLYHVLNHLNLFGMSYYPQTILLIKFYL